MLVFSTVSSSTALASEPTLGFDHLFVKQDTPIYNDHVGTEKPVGSISAYQSVAVLDSASLGGDQVWYLVETWLGPKWIKEDPEMIVGEVEALDQAITIAVETPLYDDPDMELGASFRLSPQKLHATASFSYRPLKFHSVNSFSAGSGIWYQVDTWMGKKWIANPDLLEDVHETAVSYDVKLSGTEVAYLHPYVDKLSGESIEDQVVHVAAEWDNRKGPWDHMWLKVQLPQESGGSSLLVPS
ncbi:hypothetical protein [Paenibacillus hexagrammi]|uniref:Uncharacterized protein n=1 Tax=Paenibacillus hexagrammi TaxID=2908839 RepID=A0ABY3SR84_9BACL|nr:hypothetical protein [Paenibacillus sp. YPD9-1]UJF36065.1 hypothetical protein L0M14_13895 [Paenibacillus sp. YPD9-1]